MGQSTSKKAISGYLKNMAYKFTISSEHILYLMQQNDIKVFTADLLRLEIQPNILAIARNTNLVSNVACNLMQLLRPILGEAIHQATLTTEFVGNKQTTTVTVKSFARQWQGTMVVESPLVTAWFYKEVQMDDIITAIFNVAAFIVVLVLVGIGIAAFNIFTMPYFAVKHGMSETEVIDIFESPPTAKEPFPKLCEEGSLWRASCDGLLNAKADVFYTFQTSDNNFTVVAFANNKVVAVKQAEMRKAPASQSL